MSGPRLRADAGFLLILAAALALRLHLAGTAAYIHDEDSTSIPLSKTISFTPGDLNLPLRGENHGALPAYVVKASSTIFGTTPAAYRALHLLLGLATVVLLARLADQWYGREAARWAAALFAFNEYYLTISSRATAHVPHLFLVAVALYAFSRFLAAERAGYLYAAGAAIGLAFYCKESSALLLPVFLLALLRARYRHWLRGPHVYLACLTFVLVIAPDLLWNLRTNPETTRVAYSAAPVGMSTYRNHLARIGGVGLSPYPLMFYGRSAVRSASALVTGRELADETPEYQAMNPVLGALLLSGVLATTIRRAGRDSLAGFLLLAFWCVFAFFTLIKKGESIGRLDPVSWIWVESTLLPAVILTGARLAEATGAARIAAWTIGGGALLYASAAPMLGLTRQGARGIEETIAAASHTVQSLASYTVVSVRSRPVLAMGLAVAAGAAIGGVVGFGLGWIARRRRDPRGPSG